MTTSTPASSGHAAPGHPDAVDHAATPVTRHVTDTRHQSVATVTVDLAATSLLSTLARALHEGGMLGEFIVLGANSSSARATVALADLRSRPEVLAALTLTLDPAYADDLAADLRAAADPATVCQHRDSHDELLCDVPVVEYPGYCADHEPLPAAWATRVAS